MGCNFGACLLLLIAVLSVSACVLSAHVLRLRCRVAANLELVPVLLGMGLEADSVLQIRVVIWVIRHVHVVEVLLVCHVAGVCLL